MYNSNQSLYDFGYTFLGPLLGTFIQRFDMEYPDSTPVCLAREGWALERILKRVQHEKLIKNLNNPIYFRVSRSLLYRFFMGDHKYWSYLLMKNFKGTVLQFLMNRIGMTRGEAEAEIDREFLTRMIDLPEDSGFLKERFLEYRVFFKNYANPTQKAFTDYVQTLQLCNQSQDFTFLDVGYSGTIQILLTSILQRNTEGYYFVTCVPEQNKVDRFNASIRGAFFQNIKWNQGNFLLDRSLFLESILTAPHGQIRDIRKRADDSFEFFYGREALPQIHSQDLATIINGAEDCVVDSIRNKIFYSDSEISGIYKAFVAPLSAIPKDISHLFSLDDDFSGNGLLHPAQLFGLQ
jgi:hypothetical protein